MDKHPFFMKQAPEPGQELSPLMEGLQQLKFDTGENDALTLGQNYKDDGNFYVKHKKFRLAVLSYSEGLKQKFDDNELRATLYNNRSAAQYFLKNYRSSLNDAKKAVELKPDYAKARARAAQCAVELKEFDMCVDLCDQILQADPLNAMARDLRVDAVERKTVLARDARKNAANLRKKREQLDRTLEELQKRAVKFEDNYGTSRTAITEKMLKPVLLPLEDFRVSTDPNNVLYWPAVFCYPEFTFSDFQQQLCEDTT
jgi:tetratricopeptide (TPR) repeat protein